MCVEDTGRVINPLIVEGQVHGAIAQGIGGALTEHLIYDDAGQLLTGTLWSTRMPTASVDPAVEIEHIEEPAGNLAGVRGVGEGGTLGPARCWPTRSPTRWHRSASSRIRCPCRRPVWAACASADEARRRMGVAMRSGEHYLASLRDGRAVFLDGARVDDVTKHPAFAPPIRRIAATWDLAAAADGPADYDVRRSGHRPAPQRDVAGAALGRRSRPLAGACTGCGPSRRSGSWGARPITWPACSAPSPAGASSSTAAATRFGDNVVRFYARARDEELYVAYGIVPLQIDRSQPAHRQPEPFLYPGVVAERDGRHRGPRLAGHHDLRGDGRLALHLLHHAAAGG